MAWIVDIDGTLALRGDRSPYDWMSVSGDTPNKPVIKVARALAAVSGVVFMSGRMEQCRALTRQWLHTFACTPDLDLCRFPLYMRPDDDYRPDGVLKLELYETRVRGLVEVEGVLDDRNKVVAMWRSIGLTCLQVADGDF